MKTGLKVSLIIVGGLLILGLMGGLYAYQVMDFDAEITHGDKAMLLMPKHLQDYFDDYTPIAEEINITKMIYFPGVWDIEIDYNPEADDQPYLAYHLSTSMNVFQARYNTLMEVKAMELAVTLTSDTMAFEELEIDKTTYPNTELKLVTVDGEPYGNLFHTTIGRHSVIVFLMSFYFDDGDAFAEMITPQLEAISRKSNK